MAVANDYLDDGAVVQRFSAHVNRWPKTDGIGSAETSQPSMLAPEMTRGGGFMRLKCRSSRQCRRFEKET
jgi:hypothetical protein